MLSWRWSLNCRVLTELYGFFVIASKVVYLIFATPMGVWRGVDRQEIKHIIIFFLSLYSNPLINPLVEAKIKKIRLLVAGLAVFVNPSTSHPRKKTRKPLIGTPGWLSRCRPDSGGVNG